MAFPRSVAPSWDEGAPFGLFPFRTSAVGRPLDVWPEPDAVGQKLVSWARDVVAACPTADAVRDLNMIEAQARAGDLPKFWLERELDDFEKHVPVWRSILDRVLPATYVMVLPAPSGGDRQMHYWILDLKVRALVRSNPTFFGALVEAAEGVNFRGRFVFRKVLELARDELVS